MQAQPLVNNKNTCTLTVCNQMPEKTPEKTQQWKTQRKTVEDSRKLGRNHAEKPVTKDGGERRQQKTATKDCNERLQRLRQKTATATATVNGNERRRWMAAVKKKFIPIET
jgi:hypothetical protein